MSLSFAGMAQLSRPASSGHLCSRLGIGGYHGDNLLQFVVGQAALLGLR
ncbi:hypothetical protein [Brucella intermedia]|nr:hypothetical protein [Brucella intermedia]